MPEQGNKHKTEKILNDYLADYKKMNIPYSKLTVADYFVQWLNYIQSEVKANAYRSYYRNMINHIIPYFKQNKIQLQELTAFDSEEYYK